MKVYILLQGKKILDVFASREDAIDELMEAQEQRKDIIYTIQTFEVVS